MCSNGTLGSLLWEDRGSEAHLSPSPIRPHLREATWERMRSRLWGGERLLRGTRNSGGQARPPAGALTGHVLKNSTHMGEGPKQVRRPPVALAFLRSAPGCLPPMLPWEGLNVS